MKKKLTALLLSALLLFSAAGCQSNDAQTPVNDSNYGEAVANYENYTVTLGDYQFYYRTYQNSMQLSALDSGYTEETMAEYWAADQNGQPAKDALAESALTVAKQYAVMYQHAVDSGTQVSEETKAATIADVDGLLEEVGGDETAFYDKYLVTVDDMREMYSRFDLVAQYQQDLLDSIEVPKDELDALYEENKELYDQVTVRHVLINCKEDGSMTEEQKADAKEKADDILRQLEEGADIAALAAEHSEDPGSKDNNGEYTFGKGMMVKEFEDWAFSAQPGDHGIVKTTYGYHVMEMIEHVPGNEDAVRTQLEEQLRYEQANVMLLEKLAPASAEGWTVNQELADKITVDNA